MCGLLGFRIRLQRVNWKYKSEEVIKHLRKAGRRQQKQEEKHGY